MIVIDNQDEDTYKAILSLTTQEEFIQIGQNKIYSCLKHYFPHLIQESIKIINMRDETIYAGIKKLLESYQSMTNIVKNCLKNDQIVIDEQKNKAQTIDLQKRKNTRATLAMRNSKNRQQLKKDQIFVRLIPRTHNCIHFMVKNNNFPRIQCRLSCNQHLEYLLNYLSNKWLRGKVGVGYQIKLYPDPSTYMQKYSGQGKRPAIIHQPLNNYLMFTDIMAAFGVAQNGCINLLYDITQLRKQKPHKIQEQEFEASSQNYTIKLHQPQNSIFDNIQIPNSHHHSNETLFLKQNPISPTKTRKQKQGGRVRNSSYSNEDDKGFEEKNQEKNKSFTLENDKDKNKEKERYLEREREREKQRERQRERDRRIYGFQNSLGFSQVNSMAYQINPFNSNHILGTIFNMNNSNTFLGLYNDKERVQQSVLESASKLESKLVPKQSTPQNQNPKQSSPIGASNTILGPHLSPVIITAPGNSTSNNQLQKSPPLNQSIPSQNKLQNIRNFISIIEKQTGTINSNEKYMEIGEKEENSLHKSESNFNFKKEVKTITIIKKKNVGE